MSIEDALKQIEDLVEEGKPSIVGGKVKVDAEAIRKIIEDIRMNMPDEVFQARRIANERKQILALAQDNANHMIKQAEIQSRRIVEEHEITKAAQAHAATIIDDAKKQASSIIMTAQEKSKKMTDDAQAWANDLRAGAGGFIASVVSETDQSLTQTIEDLMKHLNDVREVSRKFNSAMNKKD